MDNNNTNTISVQKSTLKDVFFYFFAFITLCYSIFHFLSVSFDIINQLVRDTLNTYNDYYSSSTSDSFRFSVASLAVVFPVFVAVSWYINREIEKNNALAQIRVRAIFIWLSITTSVLTMMGSLVTVIYYYLGGEYTTRFFLKATVVFVTALLIGGYYAYLLKRDYTVRNKYSIYIAIASVLLILSTIVYGVYVIGTPSEIRKRKLDGQRYTLLNNFTSAIESNLRMNKTLPKDIKELNSNSNYDYYGNTEYKDPETGLPIKYKVESNVNNNWQYQVCLSFDTSHDRSSNSDYQYYGNYINLNIGNSYNNDYKVIISGDNLNQGHHVGENCMSLHYSIGSTTPVNNGKYSAPAPYMIE